MRHFNRLTDIVTCSLSEILASHEDPKTAIKEIIHEMEEGLAGAQRSVATAQGSADRIARELEEHGSQIEFWTGKAKEELKTGDESAARLALVRKKEIEDVVAGLNQQHQAALATHKHLSTMLRAIEARLADAHRRLQELESGETVEEANRPATTGTIPAATPGDTRAQQIEDELEALKKELGQA